MYDRRIELRAIFISACSAAFLASIASYFLYAFAATGAPPGAAQVASVSLQDSLVEHVVEVASPAVVSVIISKDLPILEERQGFWSYGGYAERGTREVQVGGGSGFFVSSEGMIVTNKHVVSDPDASYTVVLDDGTAIPAAVAYRDPEADIAVLTVPRRTSGYDSLALGSGEDVSLGQTVIAIGNALAEFRNSVSVGVVSGLGRDVVAREAAGDTTERLRNAIQTDAAINKGNSGGPLLNLDGDVIGMNVAISSVGENISFALPASEVRRVLELLR